MKRFWIAIIVLVLAAGAGAAWWAQHRALPWTTDSAEARTELQAALDAHMKFYHREARRHLERALELDPGFVAAKLFLLDPDFTRDDDERERLVGELRRTDTGGLNRRERFLLDQHLLRREHQAAQADRALREYLQANPEDPFALSVACGLAWDNQEFEQASALYERLIEVDPNWVLARNNLGYIAMAQRQFEEAEKQFETYAYIAPDQPNPHDSMAELLALLGRYDAARAELERALALRPDFCYSYGHLLTVEILSGRIDRAAEIPMRARRHCGERVADEIACGLQSWNAAAQAAPADVWTRISEDCRDPERLAFTGARAALAAGEMAAFESYLDRQRASLEAKRKESGRLAALRGEVAHHEGIEAFANGDLEKAARKLREADGALTYHGIDDGLLKLANLAELARAQELLGDTSAAEQTRRSIQEINPRFLEFGRRVPLYTEWP